MSTRLNLNKLLVMTAFLTAQFPTPQKVQAATVRNLFVVFCTMLFFTCLRGLTFTTVWFYLLFLTSQHLNWIKWAWQPLPFISYS